MTAVHAPWSAFVVVVGCLCAPALRAQPRSDAAAVAALDAAVAKGDLTREGAPPFRLVASVRVLGEWGGERHGAYELTWLDPARWRQELTLPDYSEVRVADAGTLTIARTPDDPPERSEWPVSLMLSRVIDPARHPLQRVRKTSRRDGRTCVPVDDPDAWREILCIGDSGLIEHVESIGTARHDMSDPAPFGEALVPRTWRVRRGRSLAVEMRVTTLEELPPGAPLDAVVTHPDGTWPWCADRVGAIALAVPVTYPPRAASEDKTGLVTVSGTIGADGRVTDAKVVRSSRKPALDEQVLKATQRWKYEPARCAGSPVPSQLWATVDFRIGMYIP